MRYIILLVGLATTLQASAEGWLCIADDSVGFDYNTKSQSWENRQFNVDDERYVIRRPKEKNRKGWEMAKVGDDAAPHMCGEVEREWLSCDGGFSMHIKDGRFISKSTFGFYMPAKPTESRDSLWLTIGRCTSL